MLQTYPNELRVLVRREQPEKVAGGSRIGRAADPTKGEALPSCPICDHSCQSFPRIVVDLNTNTLLLDGRPYRLTAQQAEIMSVIAAVYPGLVTRERLMSRVWPFNSDTNAPVTLFSQLCRLRNKLRGTKFALETRREVGVRLKEIERLA
jgi:DNA-binding response OmpR family regulator